MNKKTIYLYMIPVLIICGGLCLLSINKTTDLISKNQIEIIERDNPYESTNEVPLEYYQHLDLNGEYVYNVTQFGDNEAWWWYFAGFRGMFKSDPGGKININFTGFYDRDPNDWGDEFPETNMPYYDIEIYNKSGPPANFEANNISNSEVAGVLTLGYNGFQSGFLIPISNLTNLKEMALGQATGSANGEVMVEESFNFLYISFEEDSQNIMTYLIYDRWTGLLVWAETYSYGFKMEIQSLNFTFNYDLEYNYTVNQFIGPKLWNSFMGERGYFNSSYGNHILVNFTGFYDKEPTDDSCFSAPIPFINITFVNNETFYNISNTEAGDALVIGYNKFYSGFLISTENLTLLKDLAITEALGSTNGIVTIKETKLTIKITYDQIDGDQFTSLIYDIRTGLLLWVYTESSEDILEITIEGITPGQYSVGLSNPFFSDDDEDDKLTRESTLSEETLILFISIVSGVVLFTTALSLYASKVKNVEPKFILIGIVGIACFTSLITYSYGLMPIPEIIKEKKEGEVDDITLIVDFGDSTVKLWDDISTDEDDTVFDLLRDYCDVEYEDYGENGVLVTSIDGYENGEKNWFYGVNGEKIGYSCSKYEVEDGDIINWIYGDDYSPP
ncbi:MAG: DUF4430 domain-containing protein [Promethearchaeota archaeon]|nr:MAG: DUF4430 domain-containing protein [Candidatus Lokiarchaeota archaeon]